MKKKRQRKQAVTVAVVLSVTRPSSRPDGDWASFVGLDRDVTIERALQAKDKWERGLHGPYTVFVGELTEVAEVPKVKAKVVQIDKKNISLLAPVMGIAKLH